MCSQVQYIQRLNATYKTTLLSLTMFKGENTPRTKPSDACLPLRLLCRKAQGYIPLANISQVSLETLCK